MQKDRKMESFIENRTQTHGNLNSFTFRRTLYKRYGRYYNLSQRSVDTGNDKLSNMLDFEVTETPRKPSSKYPLAHFCAISSLHKFP